MVDANGLRFRTLVDGPPDGGMFILLHGFPEGAESWARQMPALAQAGHLAVAPDMRGYGMTDAPPDVASYTTDHLVEDVRDLIHAFGKERAHVVGHDWGAVAAWYFAGTHPDMTSSLTVLSVGHPAALAEASRTDPDQQERSRYIGLFLIEGKAEEVLLDDGARRLRAMFRLGPNPDTVPDRVVESFTRAMSRPGRLTAGLNYYRANLKTGGQAWERLQRLGPITSPTHFIWGSDDPACGPRQAKETGKHVQGRYRFTELRGAGHWLQFERTDDVTRSLVEAASAISS
jgi:pimeloyl-ACP methyl ester carboxylesterase